MGWEVHGLFFLTPHAGEIETKNYHPLLGDHCHGNVCVL